MIRKPQVKGSSPFVGSAVCSANRKGEPFRSGEAVELIAILIATGRQTKSRDDTSRRSAASSRWSTGVIWRDPKS